MYVQKEFILDKKLLDTHGSKSYSNETADGELHDSRRGFQLELIVFLFYKVYIPILPTGTRGRLARRRLR